MRRRAPVPPVPFEPEILFDGFFGARIWLDSTRRAAWSRAEMAPFPVESMVLLRMIQRTHVLEMRCAHPCELAKGLLAHKSWVTRHLDALLEGELVGHAGGGGVDGRARPLMITPRGTAAVADVSIIGTMLWTVFVERLGIERATQLAWALLPLQREPIRV